MAERGNYVGIDVMKPMAPTAEKQAELDAGVASDQASTLNFDLNTLEGARNAVRPAAVLFGLSALLALLTGILLTFQADWSQLTNTSLPAAEYTAANGRAYLALGLYVNAAWVGLLAVFVFLRSRVAAVVAAIWVGFRWILKAALVLSGDFSGLIFGTLFLVFLTGAVAWALPASFAHARLSRQAGAGPDAP